jgi:hypothetical protein
VGNAAKSSSRLCFTFVNVTTPTAPRIPLPTKFAVAEKHTVRFLVARITRIAVERKTFPMIQRLDLQDHPAEVGAASSTFRPSRDLEGSDSVRDLLWRHAEVV